MDTGKVIICTGPQQKQPTQQFISHLPTVVMASKQSMFLLYLLSSIISCVRTVNSFRTSLRNINPQSSPSISREHCNLSKVSRLYSGNKGANGKTKFGRKTDEDISRFLTEFRTADGTVVDPYKILQVSRSATSVEIKQSYRRLSRKLHPDMVARMEILPGRW